MTRTWREPPGEWVEDNPSDDIPDDIEPGLTEHLVSEYIRDLRRLIGFDATREFVAYVLARESGARWQNTIDHERQR